MKLLEHFGTSAKQRLPLKATELPRCPRCCPDLDALCRDDPLERLAQVQRRIAEGLHGGKSNKYMQNICKRHANTWDMLGEYGRIR